MKRYLCPLVLATAFSSQFGCVDGGETLQILINQEPKEDCALSSSPGDAYLARGRIDTNSAGGYLFTPLIENKAEAVSGASRIAQLQGANIDLKFSGGFGDGLDGALTRFSQQFSGSIPAGGFGAYAFTVIPKQVLDSLASKLGEGEQTEVIAQVRINGSISGGGVDSNLFSYPVDVCKGCLQNNLGDCAELPSGYNISQGGNCQELQDGVLDCCTYNGETFCPAIDKSTTE